MSIKGHKARAGNSFPNNPVEKKQTSLLRVEYFQMSLTRPPSRQSHQSKPTSSLAIKCPTESNRTIMFSIS